jgi:hypothetical protein
MATKVASSHHHSTHHTAHREAAELFTMLGGAVDPVTDTPTGVVDMSALLNLFHAFSLDVDFLELLPQREIDPRDSAITFEGLVALMRALNHRTSQQFASHRNQGKAGANTTPLEKSTNQAPTFKSLTEGGQQLGERSKDSRGSEGVATDGTGDTGFGPMLTDQGGMDGRDQLGISQEDNMLTTPLDDSEDTGAEDSRGVSPLLPVVGEGKDFRREGSPLDGGERRKPRHSFRPGALAAAGAAIMTSLSRAGGAGGKGSFKSRSNLPLGLGARGQLQGPTFAAQADDLAPSHSVANLNPLSRNKSSLQSKRSLRWNQSGSGFLAHANSFYSSEGTHHHSTSTDPQDWKTVLANKVAHYNVEVPPAIDHSPVLQRAIQLGGIGATRTDRDPRPNPAAVAELFPSRGSKAAPYTLKEVSTTVDEFDRLPVPKYKRCQRNPHSGVAFAGMRSFPRSVTGTVNELVGKAKSAGNTPEPSNATTGATTKGAKSQPRQPSQTKLPSLLSTPPSSVYQPKMAYDRSNNSPPQWKGHSRPFCSLPPYRDVYKSRVAATPLETLACLPTFALPVQERIFLKQQMQAQAAAFDGAPKGKPFHLPHLKLLAAQTLARLNDPRRSASPRSPSPH